MFTQGTGRHSKKANPLAPLLILIISALLVFGAGWWAASATFGYQHTGAENQDATSPVTVTAESGKVGRVYSLGVGMETPVVPVGVNTLTGVVTKLGKSPVNNGDLLYVVGDQGVIAVESPSPFYRDLVSGTEGPDVEALQKMLISRGYLEGDPSGTYGSETIRAVKELQKALGVAQSGTLPLGTVVSLPHTPTTITFSPEIYPAAHLVGGEAAVQAPSGDRKFFISVTPEQIEFVPIGATVTFTAQGETFEGVVSDLVEQETGNGFRAIVTAADGSPVCGTKCDQFPSIPRASFLAQVRPEPEVEGIVVPAAAVRTRPTGETLVTLAGSGKEQAVKILASGQGLVVIDGVSEGTRLLVHQPKRLSNRDGATTAPDSSASDSGK